ncbi:MAG TPA: GIY-YIG nuclease family protein [Rhizomicrobium sp.]
MQKHYWTYIMASARNGTLYIGVTNDLSRRVWEHREGLVPGFTKKYGVKMLVYFEIFEDVNAAIHQEKLWKKWKRRWKLELIEKRNPEWRVLAETLNA